MKKLIIILMALILSGCATPPPKTPDAKDPITSVPEGKAVVVFFRLRQGQLLESLLFEKQKVDDLKLLSVSQADTQTRMVVKPGKHEYVISAFFEGKLSQNADLLVADFAPNKIYYVQIVPKVVHRFGFLSAPENSFRFVPRALTLKELSDIQGEIDSTRVVELDGSRFEEAQTSEKLKALLREAESRYKRANETQTRYQTVLPQYGVDSF